MKQGLAAWLLALLLAVMAAAPAVAWAAENEPLPPPLGGSAALYDEFPLEAWTFDGVNADDVVSREARLGVNRLVLLRAWAVKLGIRMAEQAFDHRPAQALEDVAGRIGSELTALLWQRDGAPLVVAGVTLAGLWAVMLWLGRRAASGWRMVLSTGLVLIVATALLASLGGLLRGFGSVSGDFAKLGFSAATRPLGKGAAETSVALVGERAWRTLVHDPWVAGEFTDAAAAEKYSDGDLPGGKLLKMSPAQRLNHYQTLGLQDRDKLFSPWVRDQTASRWLLSVTSLIAAGSWATAMVALAGAIMLNDLLIVLLAALAPVALLLALFPPLGTRLVAAWGERLLAAAINKVVAAIVLGTFVTLSATLLSAPAEADWPMAALLQVLLVAAVVRLKLFAPGAVMTALARVRTASPARGRVRDEGAAAGAVSAAGSSAPQREVVGAPGPVGRPVIELPEPLRPNGVLSVEPGASSTETAAEQLGADLNRIHRTLVLQAAGSLTPGLTAPEVGSGAEIVRPSGAPARVETDNPTGGNGRSAPLRPSAVSEGALRPRLVPLHLDRNR